MKSGGFAATLKTGIGRRPSGQPATYQNRAMPFSVDDLENGQGDWKNIPDIVRVAIMGLYKGQVDSDKTFHEFKSENNLTVLRREVFDEIETKASAEDVKRLVVQISDTVDEKVSREEIQGFMSSFIKEEQFQAELDNMPTRLELQKVVDRMIDQDDLKVELAGVNQRMDSLISEMHALQANTVGILDFSSVREKLDRKVDLDLFRDAMKTKADTDQVSNALEKKVDFEEIEELLHKKVNGEELEQLLAILERKADSDALDELVELIRSKADAKDLEMVAVAINKKAEKKTCDSTAEQVIAIKRELEAVFLELDNTFSEFKGHFEKIRGEIELCSREISKKTSKQEIADLRTALTKKVDFNVMVEEVAKIKDDSLRDSKAHRADLEKFRKTIDEIRVSQEKKHEGERKTISDTIKLLRAEMDRLLTDKEKEIGEMIRFAKNLNENLKGELAVEQENQSIEIKELKKSILQLSKSKSDSDEVKSVLSDFGKALKMKVDIDEVQSSLNACQADNAGKLIDLRDEVFNAIKKQNTILSEQISKKPNALEIKKQIASKLDITGLEEMLESYMRGFELQGLGDRMRDLQFRIDQASNRDVDLLIQGVREDIEELRRGLAIKANLQEISNILDQKCSIDDVNRSLKILKNSIQEKCSLKELDLYSKEQTLINEFLCTENIVGRWRWRSGNLQGKTLVPWEDEAINTLRDNYIWEKNDTYITVVTGGLYEVSFGLFSRKKPTGQFFVNGEPVLSLMNSSSYAVHHSSGKMVDVKGNASGNSSNQGLNSIVPTGLTFIEFIMLPPKARISLSFVCDVPGEGFLAIKRIN